MISIWWGRGGQDSRPRANNTKVGKEGGRLALWVSVGSVYPLDLWAGGALDACKPPQCFPLPLSPPPLLPSSLRPTLTPCRKKDSTPPWPCPPPPTGCTWAQRGWHLTVSALGAGLAHLASRASLASRFSLLTASFCFLPRRINSACNARWSCVHWCDAWNQSSFTAFSLQLACSSPLPNLRDSVQLLIIRCDAPQKESGWSVSNSQTVS